MTTSIRRSLVTACLALWVAVLATASFAGPARSQQNLPSLASPGEPRSTAGPAAASAKEKLEGLTAEMKAAGAPAASAGSNANAPAATLTAQELKDSLTVARFNESQRAYYQFRAQGFAYSSRAFEWQMWSTKFIFGVVMLLVIAGLWFSWMQFSRDPQFHIRPAPVTPPAPSAAEKEPRVPGAVADAQPKASEASQLKVSPQGIEVSSSVLGVVILVISLAFFYLYLVYVYPLTVVK